MNYEELKNRIFYSKYIRELQGKDSPQKGYAEAGSYARDVQWAANIIAVNNGLDADYCSALALAEFLVVPPYGKEGEIAIKEVLGETFDKKEVIFTRVKDILKNPIEEKFKKDLGNLIQRNNEEFSNEVICVVYAKDAVDAYSLLENKEKEKLGGTLLKTAMVTGVERGSDDKLKKSDLHKKIESLVEGRNIKIDVEKVEKVKKILEQRIINSALDEQNNIEKILGE